MRSLRHRRGAYCIGNPARSPSPIAKAVAENRLVAAAVLSGNRNSRSGSTRTRARTTWPRRRWWCLCARRTVDIDLERDRSHGRMESRSSCATCGRASGVADTVAASLKPEMFTKSYANVFDGNPKWNAIPVAGGGSTHGNEASTYIQSAVLPWAHDRAGAGHRHPRRARAGAGGRLGDTDHISPAGDIAEDSPPALASSRADSPSATSIPTARAAATMWSWCAAPSPTSGSRTCWCGLEGNITTYFRPASR